jgi:hypothetical protein
MKIMLRPERRSGMEAYGGVLATAAVVGIVLAVLDYIDVKGALVWIGLMIAIIGIGMLNRPAYEGTIGAADK